MMNFIVEEIHEKQTGSKQLEKERQSHPERSRSNAVGAAEWQAWLAKNEEQKATPRTFVAHRDIQ